MGHKWEMDDNGDRCTECGYHRVSYYSQCPLPSPYTSNGEITKNNRANESEETKKLKNLLESVGIVGDWVKSKIGKEPGHYWNYADSIHQECLAIAYCLEALIKKNEEQA